MNTKYTSRINRMKNTRLGKLVCRLVGEESGQAMMEYIVIAVVIAAACALIFAIFGTSIFGQTKTAIQATDGRPNKAAETIEANRSNDDAGIAEAKGNTEKIHGDVTTKTVEAN